MKNLKVAIVAGLEKDIQSRNIFGDKKLQNLIAGFYFLSVIESSTSFLLFLVKIAKISNFNVFGIFAYFLQRKI